MIQFFGYDKCSTCKKAEKFLKDNEIEYQKIDIVENPPTKKLFKQILKSGDYSLKDLFNKSGLLYREMKMKDKLPDLSESEALDLLAKYGKMVKRPIVTNSDKIHTVGFKEERYNDLWLK